MITKSYHHTAERIKMSDIKQVFLAADGTMFDTKAEAIDHGRRPLITAAMTAVTGGNAELTDWLVKNQEAVETAFESGTIKRVSKSEKAKLEKALDAIVEAGNPKFAFVADNKDDILKSFRWPSVTRMEPEEKVAAATAALVAASADAEAGTPGNEELANWIVSNKDAVLAAYDAGVVKREVSPKAIAGLAAYREEQARRKAAAAEGKPVEATETKKKADKVEEKVEEPAVEVAEETTEV